MDENDTFTRWSSGWVAPGRPKRVDFSARWTVSDWRAEIAHHEDERDWEETKVLGGALWREEAGLEALDAKRALERGERAVGD